MNRTSMNHSSWKIDYYDHCDVCEIETHLNQCDRCGTGVCTNDDCSLIFPHKYGTNFIICKTCFQIIESKLKPHINYGELRLLKSSIKHKKTRRGVN